MLCFGILIANLNGPDDPGDRDLRTVGRNIGGASRSGLNDITQFFNHLFDGLKL